MSRNREQAQVGKKMVTQGVVPLVLILCSLAYVARVFSFETLGVEWGALFLVALFTTLAAKTFVVMSQRRKLEDDILVGLLLVLAVKALGQALAWGVCGINSPSCSESVQTLEFLAFAFLAVYHGPLTMAGFAGFAALLQMGYAGGPSILHAAAEPEVVRAALPGVTARFVFDLAFGVGFGYFVRNERASRQDVEDQLQRIAREAKSFRLEEVVATPDGGLEAMSRAGREDAEMRAVTRLREKESNIARFMKQSLLCYSAVIFRYDSVTKKLELRAYRSDSRNIKEGAQVNPGEGVIGWVYNKREQLTAGNNFKPIPDLPYYAKDDEGVLSLLGYPIVDPETDRALGVIAIDSREMDVLKEQHFSTLEMAARMLVEAVRNEESRSRQETEALQLQAMLEISRQMSEELNVAEICKRVILSVFRIVPYEVASVVLWDADKKLYRVEYAARSDGEPVEAADWAGAEFGEGAESAATLAMRQDTPLVIANYRDRDKSKRLPLWGAGIKLPDIDSVLAVPLKRGGEAVGCILLGARGKDVFEETERRLFGILASLIAASLLNAQKHRATEERATTDALTGLANRVKFKEFFAQQAALAKRTKQPLSLLIMDLDHFKKVNDTYGHPAGDAVLKQMADILKTQCRETDLPTRFGGEEFIAVLVNTARKDATRMAERIRKAVAGHAFEIPDGRTIKCTVSIGAATFPEDTKREEELTDKADKALYGAKSGGRNRVQQYCDLPEREGTTSWSEPPAKVGEPEKEATVAGSKWRF